jgi:F0F1-type ATP synthase membrane subunit b/b'
MIYDLITLGICIFLLFSMIDYRRKLTKAYKNNKKIESSLKEYKELHAKHLMEKAQMFGHSETYIFTNKISLKKRKFLNEIDKMSDENLSEFLTICKKYITK